MKLWTGRIMMFHNILCDDRRVDAALRYFKYKLYFSQQIADTPCRKTNSETPVQNSPRGVVLIINNNSCLSAATK